jgi:hypothetical protein
MCVLNSIINYIQCNIEVITFCISIAALLVAIYIPRKIMANQIYADLLKEYRSTEMGEAIMGLIEFYVHDCKSNVTLLDQEYRKIFDDEIGIGENRMKNTPDKKQNLKDTLHFKRRLLWQYYWQMATLRYEYFWGRLSKKRLANNFTGSESQVITILYHTVDAVKDLFDKTGDVQEPEEKSGKTEELMYRLYEESKEW